MARLLGPQDGFGTFEADGGAPAVVAFHGFTGTVSEIRPLVDAVAAAGFAIRAPLLPGHGTAPRDLQPVTFHALLAFARAEVDAALARHVRVVVCGFSYGSLLAACVTAERPSVTGLILLGNALVLSLYARVPMSLIRRTRIPVPDAYLRKVRAADMRDRDAAARVTTYDTHPVRAAFEVYEAGRLTRARMGAIRCPALILHGAHDWVCPPSNAALAARSLGSDEITVRVYDRSAHLIAADHDRVAVAEDVLAFLHALPRVE